MTAASVLLVDDNAAKRVAMQSILEQLDLMVIEAASGEAALRAVMERTFAVILMDVQMPGMDGYQTAQLIRLRRECEHTPIIFVTSNTRDEAQVPIAYESGAVDFIFAPIVPAILRAKVAVFVELFRKTQELEHSLVDVTRLSESFRDSEAHTRSVLQNVADGIVTIDDEGRIESFNRAAYGLFGYDEQTALGLPFAALLASGTHGPGATETVGRRYDGATFPMELELTELQLGARRLQIGCMRDISQRHDYTATLRHRALHDDLTDLPNRVLFGDRVEHAIRASQRDGHPLALLLLDLDGFKRVNDTHGHQVGDELLRLVAARIVESLRAGDTVARLGGDEFGILPGGECDLVAAAGVAWAIERALARGFVVGGRRIEVSGSVGIVLYPEHGDDIDDLLRRADLAMYDAKRAQRPSAVFAVEQEEAPARLLARLTDLRRCVERGELVLHYQPKVDLATRKTIGVEALIRWNHPTEGLLPPGAFMPEIEHNDLMISITDWILGEALGALSGWRAQGHDLTMAVNLGARCLGHGTDLFGTVDALIAKWGIPPEKLTFELTESALIDTAVPGLMERLAEMGERLSIDDFGTGYSSLAYLQRLPVVEVKADRSFVGTLTTVDDDAVIVRAIIELAHNLGLTVVAEGVEDEATMQRLLEFGCDTAQGWLFAKAMEGPALLDWLGTSPYGQARRPGPPALRVVGG